MAEHCNNPLRPSGEACFPCYGDLESPSAVSVESSLPLSGEELLALLRERWQVSYDLQLVQRRGRVYLQVMWAYLEQQSFPLTPADYAAKLEQLAGVLNGLGVADQVRRWLQSTADKPRLGRALGLPLELPPGRLSEFVL